MGSEETLLLWLLKTEERTALARILQPTTIRYDNLVRSRVPNKRGSFNKRPTSW